MSIETKLTCKNPETVLFTMSVTMTAKDWQEAREQMAKGWSSSWPLCVIRQQIDELLSQSRKVFMTVELEDKP